MGNHEDIDSVYVADHVYDTRRFTEDGDPILKVTYNVCAEDIDGYRWAHERGFDTIEEAQRLVDRIEAAGRKINLDHWRVDRPVYGSLAYLLEDGEEELIRFERDVEMGLAA